MNRNDIPPHVMAWLRQQTDENKLVACLLASTGRHDFSDLNATGLVQLLEDYDWIKTLLNDTVTR